MGEIPEIVFQQPGNELQRRSATAESADEAAQKPAPPVAAETPVEDESEEPRAKDARRKSSRRSRKEPVFPVHTVTPHPLAFERARQILEESGGAYTKILPGDEPGTVVIR